MATTSVFGLPYPEPQHVPDVPKWNGDLANRVEQIVGPIGKTNGNTRGGDDAGAGWGNFVGCDLVCPAGIIFAIGVAHWGGQFSVVEIVGNGTVMQQIDLRMPSIGHWSTTLIGYFYHNGIGTATAALNGTPTDGQALQFLGGSNLIMTYMGRGAF